jgi:hypothetical protein
MERFGVLITMSKNWYDLLHLPNFLGDALSKIFQNKVVQNHPKNLFYYKNIFIIM